MHFCRRQESYDATFARGLMHAVGALALGLTFSYGPRLQEDALMPGWQERLDWRVDIRIGKRAKLNAGGAGEYKPHGIPAAYISASLLPSLRLRPVSQTLNQRAP